MFFFFKAAAFTEVLSAALSSNANPTNSPYSIRLRAKIAQPGPNRLRINSGAILIIPWIRQHAATANTLLETSSLFLSTFHSLTVGEMPSYFSPTLVRVCLIASCMETHLRHSLQSDSGSWCVYSVSYVVLSLTITIHQLLHDSYDTTRGSFVSGILLDTLLR